MKEIIESLKKVQELASAQLLFIQSRIKDIIKSKSKDSQEIEELLDILLDYQFMGAGEKEFNQLNNYYRTFDEDASLTWKRLQKELLGEIPNPTQIKHIAKAKKKK